MDRLSSSTPFTGLRTCRLGLARLLGLLARWRHRMVSRRQLQQLDSRALADLGLNQADQYREGDKPFWRE
ncbi:DUF1127 domain-containing protein [Pseudomonas oryzihabitans]|uniref:Uncharacterized protein YjiS (DUF1127 family) n=1 Tax=Pseudomonas oryzihabitans TaxID=47885 RepID=A0AAJ2EWG6_9PSED|nr:DUF1127 domain-containing protein [Pseudomonas psychrotolerans]MDR6234554.1 uncharacterized protein YjiS (DUF1127 family) [Pseudomonas psychrotolerans]MDR6356303.1 uncharacterized protein YjiS (DUF1127 family) [Pseudomonas psychrotolerans]